MDLMIDLFDNQRVDSIKLIGIALDRLPGSFSSHEFVEKLMNFMGVLMVFEELNGPLVDRLIVLSQSRLEWIHSLFMGVLHRHLEGQLKAISIGETIALDSSNSHCVVLDQVSRIRFVNSILAISKSCLAVGYDVMIDAWLVQILKLLNVSSTGACLEWIREWMSLGLYSSHWTELIIILIQKCTSESHDTYTLIFSDVLKIIETQSVDDEAILGALSISPLSDLIQSLYMKKGELVPTLLKLYTLANGSPFVSNIDSMEVETTIDPIDALYLYDNPNDLINAMDSILINGNAKTLWSHLPRLVSSLSDPHHLNSLLELIANQDKVWSDTIGSFLILLPCSLSNSLNETNQCLHCERQSQETTEIPVEMTRALIDFVIKLPQDHWLFMSSLAKLLSRWISHSSNDPIWFLNTNSNLNLWIKTIMASCRLVRFKFLDLVERLSQLDHENIPVLLSLCEELMDQGQTNLMDTLIKSLAILARVSWKSSYLLVGIKLLMKGLDHSNPILRAMTLTEIRQVIQDCETSPQGFLDPILPELTLYILENIEARPKNLSSLASLLGCTVSELLDQTKDFCLPTLVNTRRVQVLTMIAETQGQDLTRFVMSEASIILPFLLSFGTFENNDFNTCLKPFEELSGMREHGVTLSQLFQSCQIWVVSKLCLELSVTDKAVQNRVVLAIGFVEQQINGTGIVSKKPTPEFMSQFLLGIVSDMNEIVMDFKGIVKMERKQQIVKSLSILLTGVDKKKLPSAVPQIVGFLQSAMNEPLLWDAALETWTSLLQVLDAGALKTNLAQVTTLLMNIEAKCSPSQRESLKNIFRIIVINKGHDLQSELKHVPALPLHPDWESLRNALVRYVPAEHDPMKILGLILSRVSNENSYVVYSATDQLFHYLTSNEQIVHGHLGQGTLNPLFQNMISVLFETARKFHASHPEVGHLCCQCLGALGAIDPSRVSVSFESKSSESILWDLKNDQGTFEYACYILETFLVPSYRSLQDLSRQGNLAFTIQEILKFCGFSNSVGQGKTGESRVLDRWKRFSKAVLAVLEPLLHAKYSITLSEPIPEVYPIYPQANGYVPWILRWTMDLIFQLPFCSLKDFYIACFNLLRYGDTNLASLLLPELVLYFLLVDTKRTVVDRIRDETLAILKDVAKSCSVSEKHQLCSQTLFHLMDHLQSWIRSKKQEIGKQRAFASRRGKQPIDSDLEKNVGDVKNVQGFMDSVPHYELGLVAYQCRSYARALLHFETHCRDLKASPISKTEELQVAYGALQLVYSKLEDPDGVVGVFSLLNEPTLEQTIVQHESLGSWSSAQTCYELGLQSDSCNVEYQAGLLKCLQQLGQFDTVLTQVDGLESQMGHVPFEITQSAIQSAWKLGKWTKLEKLLENQESGYDLQMGRLILSIKQRHSDIVFKTIKQMQSQLMTQIVAASRESYGRAYPAISQLSLLHETVQFYEQLCGKSISIGDLESHVAMWKRRMDMAVPLYQYREPLFHLYRFFLNNVITHESSEVNAFAKLELGNTWLLSAKEARKAGFPQSAYSALLHAVRLEAPDAILERAKWMWNQGQSRQAVSELERFLDRKDHPPVQAKGEISLVSKTRLTLAKWMDESNHMNAKNILVKYNDLASVHPEWEKANFLCARYYDKLYQAELSKYHSLRSNTLVKAEAIEKELLNVVNYAHYVVKSSLRVLICGSKYYYQTMPRVMTVWLYVGNIVPHNVKTPSLKQNEILGKFASIHRLLRKQIDHIPPSLFYSALPQLVSRVSHRNSSVTSLLEVIIGTVLDAYPHQSLWHLMSVSKSSTQVRSKRILSILAKAKSNPTARVDLDFLITQHQQVTDHLIHVCNQKPPTVGNTMTMSKDFRTLVRMAPLAMILPIQSSLTAALPTSGKSEFFKPFASRLPIIQEFKDEIEIMASLQKPKKITLLGDDGKEYIFLFKPSDDLRKDSRLIEFNTMINKFLWKSADARRRNLSIRTYCVMPLNEECGMIEWVRNMDGFRNIILKNYKSKGIVVNYGDLKKILDTKTSTPDRAFIEQILPKYPSVFHEWFLEKTEPTRWLACRTAYTRTLATMSMVGHIVGLGDRHGENILFDTKTGETLHVDLNCLFDAGLAFERPERVPFRLTHNMVDALGVTGVEGAFRKCCSVTMNVLRQHRESLNTLLETFLHDPLCEWSKHKRHQPLPSTHDYPDLHAEDIVENEKAVKTLAYIDRKLQGLWGSNSLSLSVEGHVDELIEAATNPSNLFAMYIGWYPNSYSRGSYL